MTKKTVLKSHIFLFANLVLLVYFKDYFTQTIYYKNLTLVYLSVLFLTLVILLNDNNHWLLLSLVFYIKYVYFFYLVSYHVKKGLDISVSLPYILPSEKSFILASAVMSLELLTVFFGYLMTKLIYIKQSNLNYKRHYQFSNKKSSELKILMLLFLVIMIFKVENPVVELLLYSLIVIMFFNTNELILSRHSNKYIKLICIIVNFLFTAVLLLNKNRKRIIYFGYASYYYLKAMFPNFENAIKRYIIITVIILISILTTLRFGDKNLLDNFLNINTFSSYFLTLDKVATGLEVKSSLDYSPLVHLIIDVIRPIIFLGSQLERFNLKHGSLYYNERISLGGLKRGDQIFPFASQTSLLSPIVMILVIILILIILNHLDNKEYIDKRIYFLSKYLIFILSLFPIINITIIINTISYNIFPLYLIIRIQDSYILDR